MSIPVKIFFVFLVGITVKILNFNVEIFFYFLNMFLTLFNTNLKSGRCYPAFQKK